MIREKDGALFAYCDKCVVGFGPYMLEEVDVLIRDVENLRWSVNVFDNTRFRCPYCSGKPINHISLCEQSREIARHPYGYMID